MERQRRTSRRQGRRLTAQLFVVAIIATMLLTALPFSNQAGAEGGQLNEADTAADTVDTTQATEAEQAEVVDETATDEGTPPADETDETGETEQSNQADQQNLTQQADQADTAVDDLVAPPAGTSSITINKHVCYGPVSGDIYEMAQSCAGADQVYSFNLYFGIPVIATSQTNGNLAGFSGLPTGTFYVEELPSADTTGALVYCKVDDYLGNPVQQLLHFEDWNWKIEVHIATDGNMVYCDWFNLKETPETFGSVIVNKIVCPAGFDAYGADIYGIAANCHETPDPVTFTLTDVNGAQSSKQTAANPPYSATWDNVPSGALTIAEELPQGFGTPRVFCKNEKYTGEGDAELEVNVSGAVASTELKPGYDVLWCDWVNIPDGGDVEIFINKHLCPDGFYSNDPYELAEACHEAYDPFTFSINSMLTGPYASQSTGDVTAGGVHFTGLFADTWTVVEELPADYDEPIVFCVRTNYQTGEEIPYEMAELFNGNAISYELEAGFSLYCDWFNFKQGHEYGSITIIKHTCQPGYDVNAPGANPWLDCPALTNGVTFTLYHGADAPLQTMTGDSIDGAVYWGGLHEGEYEVEETFPADTFYAFVSGCVSNLNAGLAPTDIMALNVSGSIVIDLAKGENITCHWYNVPNRHGGTVIITKYWCDGDVYSIYACDLYEGGASFQIGGAQVTTGADGTASIDLDAGAYEIDEVGGKWCSAEASNVDGQGRIKVEEGETTYVTVFNCGPRETPKGKPNPGKFPNTGLGPIMSEQLAA